MNDTLLWFMAVAAGGGVPVITFITFWMTLSSRITEAQALGTLADTRAKNAEVLSTAALGKVELLTSNINDYRVDILSKMAALEAISQHNTTALVAVEQRLMKSISDIDVKMDNLHAAVIKVMSNPLRSSGVHGA